MKKVLAASFIAFSPFVAFAQTSMAPVTNGDTLIARLISIGNAAISVLISLGVIWIIYNVVRFAMAEGEDRAAFRGSIIWGIAGLAVILSIWGLVAILMNTFGLNNSLNGNQTQVNNDLNSLIPVNNGQLPNGQLPN